jgi:predicted DNA repair protein MutK
VRKNREKKNEKASKESENRSKQKVKGRLRTNAVKSARFARDLAIRRVQYMGKSMV